MYNFNRGIETIQWREECPFKTRCYKKKKGIYMEKYNIDPMSHYTDNNTSREITDRNLEVKTIRLLKESIKKKKY